MKTKKKTFDCVEMMHQGALRIYEATKDMSVEEEVAYWRKRHIALLKELDMPADEEPDGAIPRFTEGPRFESHK